MPGLADPNQLEAYRTARECERVVARFAETLPRRKALVMVKLTVDAQQLTKYILECATASDNDSFAIAMTCGLRALKRVFKVIDRFELTRMGDTALRIAALELLERVSSAFMELSLKSA